MSKKYIDPSKSDYNTIDGIDEYLSGVIAANASRRLPFNGN